MATKACLGAGFGLTASAIKTLTAAFHPGRADASMLVLNALLGLGTTLAPVFVAIFIGLGLPLRVGRTGAAPGGRTAKIPPLFWVFAAFAVLYGFARR